MILRGQDIKPEHYFKLAIYTDNMHNHILGWLYPPDRFRSSAYAILYNEFTNEIVEINKDDHVNMLTYKYVVSENINTTNNIMYVLSDIEWLKLLKEFENNKIKFEWDNNYYGRFIYKDRVIYNVTKIPEDIYMPTYISIIEKYKNHVKYPEDNTSRNK